MKSFFNIFRINKEYYGVGVASLALTAFLVGTENVHAEDLEELSDAWTVEDTVEGHAGLY